MIFSEHRLLIVGQQHKYMATEGYNTTCSPVKWAFYSQDLIGEWTFNIYPEDCPNTFDAKVNYPEALTPNNFFPFGLKGTSVGEWETIPNSVFKGLVKVATERMSASPDSVGRVTQRYPKHRLPLRMPYSMFDDTLDFDPLTTCFPRSVWFFLLGSNQAFYCYMVVGNSEDGPLQVSRVGRETRVEITPLAESVPPSAYSGRATTWDGRFVAQSHISPIGRNYESEIDCGDRSERGHFNVLRNPHFVTTTKGETEKLGSKSFQEMAEYAQKTESGNTGLFDKKIWIWKPSKYAQLSPNRGLLNWSESIT